MKCPESDICGHSTLPNGNQGTVIETVPSLTVVAPEVPCTSSETFVGELPPPGLPPLPACWQPPEPTTQEHELKLMESSSRRTRAYGSASGWLPAWKSSRPLRIKVGYMNRTRHVRVSQVAVTNWPRGQAGKDRGASITAGLAFTDTVSTVVELPFALRLTWFGANWQEIPAGGCGQLG